MNYTKTLPVTGAAFLASSGYWLALVVFICSVITIALILNKAARIK